ncbi:MAG: SDR family oxidoreductase [Bacteroidota bacterium]
MNLFITGAAKGIGAATARLFVEKGWFVGLGDVDEAGLMQMEEELGKEHVCSCVMDVTDVESVKLAFEKFTSHTGGKIDALLNNAGILHAGPFDEISLAQHRRLIDINFFGVVNCAHQALPYLEKSDRPLLINMASASSLYGIPNLAIYSSSKFAVRGLTEAWDIELAHKGIQVMDIVPKYVQSDMTAGETGKKMNLDREKTLLNPEQVAQQIWKAIHQKKLHWYIGFEIKLFALILGLIPPKVKRIITQQASHYAPSYNLLGDQR